MEWPAFAGHFIFKKEHLCFEAIGLPEELKWGRDMKLITAVIKPFKLDDLREALQEIGVQGMTVTRSERFWPAEGSH